MIIGNRHNEQSCNVSAKNGNALHVSRRTALIGGAAVAAGIPALTRAQAQSAVAGTQIVENRLHGRSAWTIANDRLRIGVLTGGGFIGELSLLAPELGQPVNVMRVPDYPTIDPDTFDLSTDAKRYGDGMQRKLMSGYMGHFVAFPHFGASSQSEFAVDYAQHGEVVATRWRREANSVPDTLTMSTCLPLTCYDFSRSIELPTDQPVAYVTETARSQTNFDRPFQWVQHITFGPPFVQPGQNFLDMSTAMLIDRRAGPGTMPGFALTGSRNPPAIGFTGETQAWAMAGARTDIYVTVCNPSLGILIGYVFDTDDSRWLLDWQEYRRNQSLPWSGRGIARGICIGNSNIGGLRAAVRQSALGGVPTYGWFDARGTFSRHYTIFAMPVGKDFRGVANIECLADRIDVTERGSDRKISIPHRGPNRKRTVTL